MAEWTVICLPVSDANKQSGIAVVLTDGDERHEVSRVAFARRDSEDPACPFEDKLLAEVAKGDSAADTMNDLIEELERLQYIARADAHEKLRAVLGNGKPSEKMK